MEEDGLSTSFEKPGSPVSRPSRTEDPGRRPAEQSVSIPLYVGGAVAQIAGLMAVAYQVSDVNWTFAWFTILLTLIGMGTSYTLRRIGAPTRLLKLGALLLGAVFIYALRSGGIFGAIVPAEALGSQEMLLVSALAFTATFCSFLLVTDEAVVFTCVWSIAIIGLTGTVNINRELILCFTVFLLAASFLLVHQNGLASGLDAFGIRRPRPGVPAAADEEDDIAAAAAELASGTPRYRRPGARRSSRAGAIARGHRWSLIKAQIAMAAAAWIAALVIGFLVAIPVQMVGRNLSLGTIIQRLRVPAAAASVSRRLGIQQRLNFDNLTQFAVGLGPIDDDPSEKMVVTSDRPSYWRGRVYDQYNGKGWVNSAVVQARFGYDLRGGADEVYPRSQVPDKDGYYEFVLPQNGRAPRAKTVRQVNRFHIESGSFSPMYHAAEPVEVHAPASVLYVRRDNSMGTRYASGFDYEVTSEVSVALPRDLKTSGTNYPRDILYQYVYQRSDSDVLAQIAQAATQGVPNDPYDRAEAIRRFVGQRCTYTLDARPVPATKDAAEFFLTESREGYCDLYATATTLLCRFAGIPARVVTGFAPGTASDDNPHRYVLHGSDQHAWTEVYFQGYGWIPFDATQDTNGTIVPPHTPEPVKKQTLWDRILASGNAALALTLIGAAGVLYVIVSELSRRLRPAAEALGGRAGSRRRAADQITRLYVKAVRRVARHAGLPFTTSTTPGEFQRAARERLGDTVADALAPLTSAVEAASYGPDAITPEAAAASHAALPRLGRALRETPRYRPPRKRRSQPEETAPDASVAA